MRVISRSVRSVLSGLRDLDRTKLLRVGVGAGYVAAATQRDVGRPGGTTRGRSRRCACAAGGAREVRESEASRVSAFGNGVGACRNVRAVQAVGGISIVVQREAADRRRNVGRTDRAGAREGAAARRIVEVLVDA